ncbi:hypothetical protein EDB80DRAFT_880750 [Ilyonectria destructans]|nr:hypothetical protein EDB80DRAFT_880750 [Ilyonectria destructans]
MISEAAMKATPPIPLVDLTVPGGVLHGLQMTCPTLEAARKGFDKMLEQRVKHHHNQENQYGERVDELYEDLEERRKHQWQKEGDKVVDGLDAPIPSSPMLHCAPLWISEGENDGDDEYDNIFLRMPTPPLDSTTQCLNPTVWRLRSGSRLPGLDVFNLLRRLVSLSPFDAVAVDPRMIDKPPSQAMRDQIAEASRMVFVPVYLAEMQHWVLVVLQAPNKLALLDPLPTDDMDEICERIEVMQLGLLSMCGNKWESDSPEVYRVECAPLESGDDCAVALLVNAMHMLTQTDPFSNTGYRVWRRVFAVWIQDDTCVLDNSLCEPLRISLNSHHHIGLATAKFTEYRKLHESTSKVAKVLGSLRRIWSPSARHEHSQTHTTWEHEFQHPAIGSQSIHGGLLNELIQSQAALEILESRRFRSLAMKAELKECIAGLERQHRECLANRGHVERILEQLDVDMAQLERKMKDLQDFVQRWE